ncbi:hypothetical protein K2173_008419 [Erythroxylum novogranatense]|uniref:Leucine-rich repeat-containing N-terminal plant-type domain-containing protein n=1 Tax=Erythroxylum novogranatense TaxID=1862640 RepID=A0AAV8S516_9ROSI|nr:hypothetical protein K2173_008419 [Erythroxylum novogranatense]
MALLNWKSTLDNRRQLVLSSWTRSRHCKWKGIACDSSVSVAYFNLSLHGLTGSRLEWLHLWKIGTVHQTVGFEFEYEYHITPEIESVDRRNTTATRWIESLRDIEFSHNNLSGPISSDFDSIRSLTTVNLSCNQREGAIRDLTAFHNAPFEASRNNKGLCGNATGFKPCPPTSFHRSRRERIRNLIIFPIISALCTLLLLLIVEFPYIAGN